MSALCQKQTFRSQDRRPRRRRQRRLPL